VVGHRLGGNLFGELVACRAIGVQLCFAVSVELWLNTGLVSNLVNVLDLH
jgi:hypothetical protein